MYYSERFNSITHLVGAVLALMGFGSLLTIAVQQNSLLTYVGYTVFGLTLVLLYSFSTLYHSIKAPAIKKVFRKLDHITIYLLIAGTYTPFLLITLIRENGIRMLVAIWTLAAVGIAIELIRKKRSQTLQIIIYLLMGWLMVVDFDSLQRNLAPVGVIWLFAGGIAYTVGVIFYVLDHKKLLKHSHGIWHLFVLAGSIFHFISVVGYVR